MALSLKEFVWLELPTLFWSPNVQCSWECAGEQHQFWTGPSESLHVSVNRACPEPQQTLGFPLPSVGWCLLEVCFLSGVIPFPECRNPWIHSSLKHWSYDRLDLCSCGQGDRCGLCSEALLIGESSNRKQLWREEILLEYRAGYGRTDLSVFSVWIHSRPLIIAVVSQSLKWLNYCVLTWDKSM